MKRQIQTKATQLLWWTSDEDPDLTRKRLIGRIKEIRTKAKGRRDMFYRYADFYGTSLRYAHRPEKGGALRDSRLTFNYARSYLDTWVSQMCKSRVLPMVSTTGASNDDQKRARGLNLFFGASFDRCGVFRKDPIWTRDAGIFGTGIAYTCEDDGKPCVMRVLPTEIDYDEFEWRNGPGRSFYWTVPMDRQVLKAKYVGSGKEGRELERAIDHAPQASVDDAEASEADTVNHDLVTVRLAWHLPSGHGKEDGRMGVFIDTATLAWEPYEYDDLPFSFFPRTQPLAGFWGDAIMPLLIPGQSEMDFMSDRLQEEALMMTVSQLMFRRGAKISKNKDSNETAAHIEVDDVNADVKALQLQHNPALIPYIEFLKTNMGTMSTVSPMAAMGEKPTGITAAKALELMDDQDNERKLVPQRNREAFYIDIARKLKRVAEGIPKFRILARDKRSIVDVELSKVKLDDDALVYEVQPSSALAKTISARIQDAMDMVKLGSLPPDEVNDWLQIPDREAQSRIAGAMKEWIVSELEGALYDGKAPEVHPLMNMALARKLCGDYFALGSNQKAPAENLQLIADFAVMLQKTQEMQNPPAAPAGGPAPPGVGGPNPGGDAPMIGPRPERQPMSVQ
jgi:hypothetical protein